MTGRLLLTLNQHDSQQIETFTAKSSSKASVTNGAAEALTFENQIRDTKNNFDGYEKYLYSTN